MSFGRLLLAVVLFALGPAGALAEPSTGADRLSYLGIHARSNTNMLDSDNVYVGLTVEGVVENSPAEAAGLLVGDILLRAGDTELTSPGQLSEITRALPVGAELALFVERGRRLVELEIRTIARVVVEPPPEPPTPRVLVERRRLGFEFRTPSIERANELGLAEGEGVEVLRLARRSPFHDVEIAAGDVLIEADALRIESPDALLAFLDAADRRKSVDFKLAKPRGKRRSVDVRLFRPEERLVDLNLPPFFWFDREEGKSSFSLLFGLYKRERYETGARHRVLWIFSWKTGTWDELVELEEKP
jgi:S1-C subfamily serine protease